MLWSCLGVFSRSQWGVGEGGRSEKSLAHPGSFLTSSTQCNIHWNLWKFHPSSLISSILFFPCPCRIPNRNLAIPLLALLGCLHLWTYEITSVWFVVFGITLIGLVCPVTLSKVTVPQHSYCSRLLNPLFFPSSEISWLQGGVPLYPPATATPWWHEGHAESLQRQGTFSPDLQWFTVFHLFWNADTFIASL